MPSQSLIAIRTTAALPVALRHFPQARVLMTEPSYFLIERVLHNSVNVMKRQRTERNIPDYPLFHHNEVDEFSYLFQGFKYGKPEPWSPVRPSTADEPAPTVSFHPAGHVLAPPASGGPWAGIALHRRCLFP